MTEDQMPDEVVAAYYRLWSAIALPSEPCTCDGCQVVEERDRGYMGW